MQVRWHSAQVGFISGGECQLHLVRALSEIRIIKSRKGSSAKNFLTFLDYKAAFDSINHDILFEVLEKSKLERSALEVIKLLYNHYRFSVGGGEGYRITRGCAQGSLLSPFLFNIYVNPLLLGLEEINGKGFVFAYADDVSFISLGLRDVERSLQFVLAWSAANKMEVNVNKSGILTIKKNRRKPDPARSVLSFPVLSNYKYLGIDLENSFTLCSLDNALKAKTNDFAYNIKKFCPSAFPVSLRLLLWKVFMRSVLDYSILSFASLGLCKLKLYEKHFYKTLKCACSLPKQVGHDSLLRLLRIWSPRRLCLFHIHRVAHKIKERSSSAEWPAYLTKLWTELKSGDSFLSLDTPRATLRSQINLLEFGPSVGIEYDLLIALQDFDHRFLRACLGTLLDLRAHLNYSPDANANCKNCRVGGSQCHFLDQCPLWHAKVTSFKDKHRWLMSTLVAVISPRF